MGPITEEDAALEAEIRPEVRSATPWLARRRNRLLYWFILGPLAVAAGIGLYQSEGWTFYTVWYLGIGGLVIAIGVAEFLSLFPERAHTREDAILALARPRTLGVVLLIGGLAIILATALSYMSWSDGLLRLAMYVSFSLLLFGYAQRWTRQGHRSHAKNK